MQYTTVTNLQWSNKNHTSFSCNVNFVGLGVLPFAPTPNDPQAYGKEIYARCMAGEFGEIEDYVLQPDEYPAEVIQNITPTEGSETL
jgi:hypothetical protein